MGMTGFCRTALTVLLLALSAAWPSPARAHYIDMRKVVIEPGVLTVGIALSGRPFAYREDGILKGFEVDLAGEIAQSRGLALKAVQLPRKGLVAALRAGQVDAVNSMPLDGKPPAGVAVVPYLVVGDHMMILKKNPFHIKSVEDLAGETVSTPAGTSAEAFAREIDRHLVAEGRPAMQIHSFPNEREVHFPVSMGHAAAYFIDTSGALVPTLDPESRVGIFPGVFKPRRAVGLAVLADKADLKDALEHAIAAKVANGTYDRLREEYGVPDELSDFR